MSTDEQVVVVESVYWRPIVASVQPGQNVQRFVHRVLPECAGLDHAIVGPAGGVCLTCGRAILRPGEVGMMP